MIFSKTLKAAAESNPDYWRNIFLKVYGSPDGRKALLWLLMKSGILDTPTTFDPNEAQYLAYKKVVVMELMREMDSDPVDIILDGESAESNLAERMGETTNG